MKFAGKNESPSESEPLKFTRVPALVNRTEAGKLERVACIFYNRCLAAVVSDLAVRCYQKGFPKS